MEFIQVYLDDFGEKYFGIFWQNFSEFKNSLAEILVDKIIPISVEIKKLLEDKKYLEHILSEGHKKANNIASNKLKKIHELVGF